MAVIAGRKVGSGPCQRPFNSLPVLIIFMALRPSSEIREPFAEFSGGLTDPPPSLDPSPAALNSCEREEP